MCPPIGVEQREYKIQKPHNKTSATEPFSDGIQLTEAPVPVLPHPVPLMVDVWVVVARHVAHQVEQVSEGHVHHRPHPVGYTLTVPRASHLFVVVSVRFYNTHKLL